MTESLVSASVAASIPASILSDPRSAPRRVACLAGVACGGAGLAGMFLRFDDGLVMRLVIATTSAVFGAVVVSVALSAKSTWNAIGRALGLSTVLGMVSTVIPSAILCANDAMPFLAFLVAGIFFGAFTGFFYGLVLAAVAGLTFGDVARRTHDGADRATRTAALWALFPGLLSTWIATGYDARRELSDWASAADRAAHDVAVPLGVTGAVLTIGAALALAVLAQRRLRRRRAWLSNIAFDATSEWSVRARTPHDDVAHLPRLREGAMVLERRRAKVTYRENATSEAVALL